MKPLTRLTLSSLFFLSLTQVSPGQPAPAPITSFNQVNTSGFGDRQNSLAWSMAWFNGKLYVGTARNFQCLTDWTIEYFYPTLHAYSAQIDPAVPCTPSPYNLDLQAEVWSYDPGIKTWSRVYKSLNSLPIPAAPGKLVAPDIGYRDMIVYNEPGSSGGVTSALYVAGVTAREYIPGLPLPRLLRSTDGVNFTPIQLTIDGIPPNATVMGLRSTASYNGKMYLTASIDLAGEGMLIESAAPWTGHFRVVTSPNLLVYELSTVNGYLYVGLTDKTNGYSVWKTKATGNPPYTLTPVVLFGAGRGTTMVSVVSMHVFNGALYVGSSGWAPNPYPPCEMIRINPDDSWQVVVGNPRRDPSTHVLKSPLSGLPDGFGNPYNAHIWRMEDHDGVLYAGTNDVSWWHRSLLQWIPGLAQGFGFDLFASADGVHWTTITKSGFGVPANYGCRTMISSPDGLFVGSADEAVGTQVFLGRGATDALPAAAPTRTLAEVQGGSPLISWNPSSTTSQYSVYRAPYRKMEVPNPDGEAANNDVVNVPGAFSKIGTTDKPFFQDRSASGSSPFLYYVQADGPRGQSSNPSNFVYVSPSATIPPVTFNQVQNAVGELAGIATLASSGPDYGLFDQALAAQAKGDLATALSALESLQSQVAKNPNGTLSSAKAQDLEIMIGRLARRVKLAKSGLIPRKSLDKSR